jgi:hypothetical protein
MRYLQVSSSSSSSSSSTSSRISSNGTSNSQLHRSLTNGWSPTPPLPPPLHMWPHDVHVALAFPPLQHPPLSRPCAQATTNTSAYSATPPPPPPALPVAPPLLPYLWPHDVHVAPSSSSNSAAHLQLLLGPGSSLRPPAAGSIMQRGQHLDAAAAAAACFCICCLLLLLVHQPILPGASLNNCYVPAAHSNRVVTLSHVR